MIYFLSVSIMITRQELFEEVKKGSKAKPGSKDFGLEALKILYALHHSYFESQGLFLNEDKFKANQVVIKAVQTFRKGCGERWKGGKMCFKNKKWFSVSLNFSTEKDNFEMHSVAVQEQIEESQKLFNEVTRKHEEAKRIRESGKIEEAKKIRESVSSTDVLILATTQALRERSGGHSSVADVLEAIKDNECLATQVTMLIDNLKDENYSEIERDAILQQPLTDPLEPLQTTDNIKEELSNSFEIESHDIELMK